jgi:hypothetical protein
MRAIAYLICTLLLLAGSGLAARPPGQARTLLERLVDSGYEAVRIEELEAQLLQPCTLTVYPRQDVIEAYFVAMGGGHVLDLEMVVHGEGWIARDTLPDDLPILLLDSTMVSSVRFVELTILDTTHQARSDTISFITAFDIPPTP